MDAKSSWLSSLLVAVSSLAAVAAQPASSETDEYAETLAPTVTTASCSFFGHKGNGCQANDCDASICDIGNNCFACDANCNGGCDSCSLGRKKSLACGLIKPSDRCFDDFISPMTNPVFFEDPRTLTEARMIFLHHVLPEALGGNSVQVYALQVRAALSKRLSVIAVKDGLVYTQSPVLDSGYADIAAGLKYTLFHKPDCGWLLSVGFTYEAPSGSNKSLQGNGDGVFNIFSSLGLRLGEKAHLISTRGVRMPLDEDAENRVFYWSNHLDRQLGDRPIYVLAELNWYNYMSSGNAFPLPLEGGDLFNFGSPNITGNDLVTGAIGGKVKPRSNIETGIAWEFPMTAREGILDNRFTADLIFRY